MLCPRLALSVGSVPTLRPRLVLSVGSVPTLRPRLGLRVGSVPMLCPRLGLRVGSVPTLCPIYKIVLVQVGLHVCEKTSIPLRKTLLSLGNKSSFLI